MKTTQASKETRDAIVNQFYENNHAALKNASDALATIRRKYYNGERLPHFLIKQAS